MRSELEIALADTDTCAEQQGPALAVVIAYCMEMSHPQPRSGGQHAASLLHGAGRIHRAQLDTVCLGKCCTSFPPRSTGSEQQGYEGKDGNESILQLFKLSRWFQVPGRQSEL